MNISPERLADHLTKGLSALYVVYGDEPLTAIETADSLRSAARAAGYTERSVYTVQGRYNWNAIFAGGDNLSLFAERRLNEIHIPSGKPGVEGSKALETYANALPADSVSLITLPGIEWRATQSRWFMALAAVGTMIEAKPIERAALPGWMSRRLAKYGLVADRDALQFVAERVEGNLLAAQQEIDKLALLLPAGKVTLADVENAVTDVSRLDAELLQDALWQGDTARYARIVADLQHSGEHPVAFMWRLTDVVRTLLRLKLGTSHGEALGGLMKQLRVRDQRRPWVEQALARLSQARVEAAQALLALLDRQAKGLERSGDPWDTILQMGIVMAVPTRNKK
ncbi:MAG: DNA polymerase III subunit delta [Thiobacillus sp.]